MYACAKCGKAAVSIKGEIVKACRCDGPVTANLEAKMTGYGGLLKR